MKQWTFTKHIIASFIILLIFIMSKYILNIIIVYGVLGIDIFSSNEAASIAMISGSDGPTAIYSLGNKGLFYSYGQYLVAFIILLVLYYPFSRFIERVNNKSI